MQETKSYAVFRIRCMHACMHALAVQPGHKHRRPICSSVNPPDRIRHHAAPEAVRNGSASVALLVVYKQPVTASKVMMTGPLLADA